MKFGHMADCHLGGWADNDLRQLGLDSFSYAIDKCIAKRIDFLIIAGDLFDTSRPSIESLDYAVKKLKDLQKNNIPVYAVSGSHDYSPSGKTMLNVLESAGLLKRVDNISHDEKGYHIKVTTDEKTGANLYGVPGKKRIS